MVSKVRINFVGIANLEGLSGTALPSSHGLTAGLAEQCFIASQDKGDWQPSR